MADTAEKRTITVFGARGAQGGALARAILSDPAGEFRVRAVTRQPDSDGARELARLGAEVVQADMDDAETLVPAFEGVYGAFLMTNFWEHMSAEREKAQAAAIAGAAGHAGVQHVIWSTLEDTRECIPLDDDRMPTLQGSYKVPDFDGKAEADHYFTDAGAPTTFLRTTFFWENLLTTSAPQRGEDGILRLNFPMGTSRLSGIAVDDIGKTALAILKRGTDLIGATVSIAGEHLRVADMARALTETLGEPVEYLPLTPDAYRALDFPAAEEAGNMFQFYADCEERFTRARDLAAIRELNPELQDFATWLAAHRDALRTP
ncbi:MULTISPECIES: NmrA/HSCARG family protein [unclassified Streptomyces]|uniref:NmrA/HSCARG family protein n=1 Tax=unclassified Streptomyces TaxID=2593676 RepID=UPI001BE95713|nr:MULTISPECIES: NmrA/HSCARG family protein [unclassified Streptomyces]MBT2408523.1 NmrA/HSCARG family protein [Streptomyces sp. ISL-21]MBT2459690.1 NmrA/HSCARG family protein [Streptomyces sp. ISL-86]MBT2611960.1 NmrA/HSCARG family protein [Streptomyces sp. ISL-87]